jgi:integrase
VPPCRTASELDELLLEFMHCLYFKNGARQTAANLVNGLAMRCPSLRGQLNTSKLALKGWAKLRPSVPFPPLTWPLTVAIACEMSQRGLLLHAVGVLLSFHCLLRVGELTQLTKADIAVQNDDRLGLGKMAMLGALRLRKTKTGPNQWVEIEDVQIMSLLNIVTEQLQPSDRVFPFSAASLRRAIKLSCSNLGIDTHYVPHSLRHGGATRLSMLKVSIEEIMRRGRWQSSKSARRYIQSGQALLLSLRTPPRLVHLGLRLSVDLVTALAAR